MPSWRSSTGPMWIVGWPLFSEVFRISAVDEQFVKATDQERETDHTEDGKDHGDDSGPLMDRIDMVGLDLGAAKDQCADQKKDTEENRGKEKAEDQDNRKQGKLQWNTLPLDWVGLVWQIAVHHKAFMLLSSGIRIKANCASLMLRVPRLTLTDGSLRIPSL